jgi:subtilisin family serine protease
MIRGLLRPVAATFALGAALTLVAVSATERVRPVRARVDPAVAAATARGGRTHFVVVLRPRATGTGAALIGELRRTAAASQRRVTGVLDRLGAPHRAYWVVNAVAAEGGRAAVDALARLPEVASIEADPELPAAEAADEVLAPRTAAAVEWNVARINAPALWEIGVTGQGVVYANADTGVVWDHAALKSHYRGWNGTAATHDYNWWDAVHADIDGNGTNYCGFSQAAPCDDDSGAWHGTHTVGTAIGDDGAGNQIGVAPGAKWISCRNMDTGTGRQSTYIECLQFFLAPTDLQGRNPRPDLRPDVVGNSYSCPPDELCAQDALKTAVDNMRAAGIFMAVSAGNEGPACSTIDWPPGQYDSAVTVGAVNNTDTIAAFSSRGPIDVDGSLRRKPDLVAPGVSVRSSSRNGYATLNGTSMAAPHVGGAVALLWSAFPNLRGHVDATEKLLEDSAVPLTTTQGCGGDAASAVPNNVYGYGRLDVYAAYRLAETQFPPSLDLADVSAPETKPLTFTVTLARPSTRAVAVAYATADITAKQGSDYLPRSGTLSFAAGERTKTVTVSLLADGVKEPRETFALRLSGPVNAVLARSEAVATIVDAAPATDRTPPRVSRLEVSGRTVAFTLSETAATTTVVKRGRRVVTSVRKFFSRGRRSVRLPVHAPGRYAVAVTARDAAGNTSRATLAFSVKQRR